MSGIAGTSARDTEIRLPRATKVKNKQPASQQVKTVALRRVRHYNSIACTNRTIYYLSFSCKIIWLQPGVTFCLRGADHR